MSDVGGPMESGDRNTIASSPMTIAWRQAAADLQVRFEAPFALEHQGSTFWSCGWLPSFGCASGAVIADRFSAPEIFEVCDALGYYASGLSPYHYETYDRASFMETLNDWGWFGSRSEAPAWFTGRFGGRDSNG